MNNLHPRPLTEAREVYLNENQLQELLLQFPIRAPDIQVGEAALQRPFVVMELDLELFGDTLSPRGRRGMALERLRHAENYPLVGLSTELLYRGKSLTKGKRNRLAWLSDVAFWPTNNLERAYVDTYFLKQEEVAEAA